jgi:hypothetical protein
MVGLELGVVPDEVVEIVRVMDGHNRVRFAGGPGPVGGLAERQQRDRTREDGRTGGQAVGKSVPDATA